MSEKVQLVLLVTATIDPDTDEATSEVVRQAVLDQLDGVLITTETPPGRDGVYRLFCNAAVADDREAWNWFVVQHGATVKDDR